MFRLGYGLREGCFGVHVVGGISMMDRAFLGRDGSTLKYKILLVLVLRIKQTGGARFGAMKHTEMFCTGCIGDTYTV